MRGGVAGIRETNNACSIAHETFNPVPTPERLHEVFGPVEVHAEPGYFDANPMASPMRCDKAREMLDWTPGIDWAALDAG